MSIHPGMAETGAISNLLIVHENVMLHWNCYLLVSSHLLPCVQYLYSSTSALNNVVVSK